MLCYKNVPPCPQVRAVDADAEDFGLVKYELVSGEGLAVDPNTGEVGDTFGKNNRIFI